MTRFLIRAASLVSTASLVLTACSSQTPDKSRTELRSDSLLEIKFEQLTKQAIADSVITFRFDTLTNFSWDTLIIIPSYWNIDKLEMQTHKNLTAVKKAGLYRENINVFAFIKEGQLIKCVQLPRNKGDFASMDSVVFSKANCVFEFIRTSSKYIATGQPVVEAKIKRTVNSTPPEWWDKK